MIVMGTSLGGMKALQKVFSALPGTFPAPLAVVMHRHKEADDFLVQYLQRDCALPVAEVMDKDPICPGRIYLAPADYHLLVEPGYFSLSVDDQIQFARPSIDVLFESAADVFGAGVIGVVLTGANHDGADGAGRIQRQGGVVVVEDPKSAVCPVMPEAAIRSAASSHVCALEGIAALLVRLTSAKAIP